MGEETGVTRGIFELFEIILPVALFILVLGGIIFVSNPNYSRSYMLEKDISYTSSLISENTVVELDLKNTKLEKVQVKAENNKISVNVKDKNPNFLTGSGARYFGDGVIIEQKSENVILISK